MTTTITYRKTKTGEWVAFGPVDKLTPGRTITVTLRSGQTKQETVERVGKPFAVNGRIMAYGYLRKTTARSGHTGRPAGRRACITGGNCSSYSGRDCGGYDCDAN